MPPTLLRAVLNILPIFSPFFTPSKGAITAHANLGWQVRLTMSHFFQLQWASHNNLENQ